jgi:hypothetical protein
MQEEYANAFAPLRLSLKVIRIAPLFKANTRDGHLGPETEEAKFAICLAQQLPLLTCAAFQCLASLDAYVRAGREDTWNHWTRYDVIRDGASSGSVCVSSDGFVFSDAPGTRDFMKHSAA